MSLCTGFFPPLPWLWVARGLPLFYCSGGGGDLASRGQQEAAVAILTERRVSARCQPFGVGEGAFAVKQVPRARVACSGYGPLLLVLC